MGNIGIILGGSPFFGKTDYSIPPTLICFFDKNEPGSALCSFALTHLWTKAYCIVD